MKFAWAELIKQRNNYVNVAAYSSAYTYHRFCSLSLSLSPSLFKETLPKYRAIRVINSLRVARVVV